MAKLLYPRNPSKNAQPLFAARRRRALQSGRESLDWASVPRAYQTATAADAPATAVWLPLNGMALLEQVTFYKGADATVAFA